MRFLFFFLWAAEIKYKLLYFVFVQMELREWCTPNGAYVIGTS